MRKIFRILPLDIRAAITPSAAEPVTGVTSASISDPPPLVDPATIKKAEEIADIVSAPPKIKAALSWLRTPPAQYLRRLLSVSVAKSTPPIDARLAALLSVIYRESRFIKEAKNPSSSASGLVGMLTGTRERMANWLKGQQDLDQAYKSLSTSVQLAVQDVKEIKLIAALDVHNWSFVYKRWYNNGAWALKSPDLNHPNIRYAYDEMKSMTPYERSVFLYSIYHVEGTAVFSWLPPETKTGTKLVKAANGKWYDPLTHKGDYVKDAKMASALLPLIQQNADKINESVINSLR